MGVIISLPLCTSGTGIGVGVPKMESGVSRCGSAGSGGRAAESGGGAAGSGGGTSGLEGGAAGFGSGGGSNIVRPGPISCGRYPTETADQYIRLICVHSALGTFDCAFGLRSTLDRCHGFYRWFVKVNFGADITRCHCDYCGRNVIGPYIYDIAGQQSPCFRPLPQIPASQCKKSFFHFWKQMKKYGACFVTKVRNPIHAFWSQMMCQPVGRYCPTDTFFFAFK